jgi:hypothetical protein
MGEYMDAEREAKAVTIHKMLRKKLLLQKQHAQHGQLQYIIFFTGIYKTGSNIGVGFSGLFV